MFKAQSIIQYRILQSTMFKGVSRATTECEMELFLIKDNGWKSQIFVSKSSILHFLVVLDTLLMLRYWWYMTYLFSFSFSPHEVHKKGNLFQTFFHIKKTNTGLVNPIWTCFIPCFFLYPQPIQKHRLSSLPQMWQPLLFPVWMALLFFLGEAITSSVVIVRVATIIVLDDGWSGSHSDSITMIFMGFPILQRWLNSYTYFPPRLNFNLFCLKLD